MFVKSLLVISIAVLGAACSADSDDAAGFDTPETAVVAWIDSVDSGDWDTASSATYDASLALVLGLENGLDATLVSDYLDNGVPPSVQAGYWSSFSDGFVEFASRPLSTLAVGESSTFSAEGVDFATVPLSYGSGETSAVITRLTSDGYWTVDLVASLGDGFAQLLSTNFDGLPFDESGDRVRTSYRDDVVPSLWAAMASESFGDDFNRSALAIIETVSKSP